MKILIDVGHGGSQTGAWGKVSFYNGEPVDTLEKDLNLKVANELRAQLKDKLGIDSCLSRDGDLEMAPDDRIRVAVENACDAIISVHFNSTGSHKVGTVEGYETYYALTKPEDKAFADCLHRNVVKYFAKVDRGLKDDTLSQYREKGLAILRNPPETIKPRALVEIEYLNNPVAMNKLGINFDERMADFCHGVVMGIKEYLNI